MTTLVRLAVSAAALTLAFPASAATFVVTAQANIFGAGLGSIPVTAGGQEHRWFSQYRENTGDVTATATASSAVPEPATWALMLVGFAAAGGAMRVRHPVRFATA